MSGLTLRIVLFERTTSSVRQVLIVINRFHQAKVDTYAAVIT